ncbi:MAG TPA: tRNA (adenosine(37)-N6)-threonylcarbamoyltransferase complex ATPase subunit type 1 TsaE [Burkholderiales bacterium]|nr:tRNA (adenosine(37)-N6)-threonylcarbamoyltransferase complex ATPase subunit type 1 TsaE [Burkholderiales bacterium]
MLETQLDAPLPDVPSQHLQIRRLRLTALHTVHLKRDLPAEADTLALGAALAGALESGTVVYLEGPLGAGKTTLARGILRGLGYTGRVKSPTFTLVEVYEVSSLHLYHFDFYRFDEPRELADAGLREYFGGDAVALIEWPEKASGLPAPDVEIKIEATDAGRTAELHANTEVGRRCLTRLMQSRTP